jgi:aspartate racemase
MIGVIGVIGVMGPLATADFMHPVIRATPASGDAQHVPLLASNDPRIPARPAAILDGCESPLPRLLAIHDRLRRAGATALAMPCNTAHFRHAALPEGCAVPFPSIVDAACDEAAARLSGGGRVGLIATRATLAAGLFAPALASRRLLAVLPSDEVADRLMLPAIARVKAGRLAEAGPLMAQAVRSLQDAGVEQVLLACTEAPIALDAGQGELMSACVDTTAALARATVALWQRQGGGLGRA